MTGTIFETSKPSWYKIIDKCGKTHVLEASQFAKQDGDIYFFTNEQFIALFNQPCSIEFYTGQIPDCSL